MPNMSLKKMKMPVQVADERVKNFTEVALGYTDKMAKEEAERCLNCKTRPCVAGCPVSVKIPEFINCVKEGKFKEAYYEINDTNSLPAICGRVCPQETQCEQLCVRGKKGEPVAIGRLERYVADWAIKNIEQSYKIKDNGIKVAIIGSGPSGLTCAGDLAKMGYKVTVFEAFHVAGGVLMYGIPEFRLPKSIVQTEIEGIKKLGVTIETNMVMGRVLSIDDLFEEGYEAVFVGTGAGLPVFMKMPGENLNGTYSSNEFLTRINLMKAYKGNKSDTPVFIGDSIAVVGGGNVAMDAARCAKRMGAKNVYIIYRRSDEEMPARREEIEHAGEEGVIFKMLTNPTRILDDGNGWVGGLECVKMELGEPDASGRRRPVVIKGSEHIVDVDMVIIAIGQTPNPLIKNTTPDIETNKWGCIIVNGDNEETTKSGVFAGGDAVTGAATVILAMGAGKKAAKGIDDYIKEKHNM